MSDEKGDDDKVGYCRPPKHSQFKKGVSGNARGRPRKSSRAPQTTEIEQLFSEVCGTTRDKGKARPITGGEAVALAQIKKAVQSVPAAAALFRLERSLMKQQLKAPLRDRPSDEESRGGVLLVPAILPLDEWEAMAVPMQRRLLAEVRL